MFKTNHKRSGAAAIIAAMVISAAVLTIAISTAVTANNNQISTKSFLDSTQAFYASESGLGEAIMQLRREPTNFIFATMTVSGFEVNTVFVDDLDCGTDCLTNIEATASSTGATRKVKYTCNNDISNCRWFELIP
ncbi:MAG: hypothetical protein C3F02_03045 [Parcubacteria group bacterium]|nr:MAG: hypothetical protein C3F02_03045 [Parcubacteria group bacterium]